MTPACDPGTAPAVIHLPRIRPRPYGRRAVECSCKPGCALAVAPWETWDANLVLAVHRGHTAVAAQRIAEAERELAGVSGHA